MVSYYLKVSTSLLLALLIINCEKVESPIIKDTNWQKLTGGLVFPEGPAVTPENIVYFSNCNGGWIGKFEKGKMDTFISKDKNTFEKTNGMIYHNNFLYACEYGTGKIIKISSPGMVEDYATMYDDKNFSRPNDLTFDCDGNLYFSDPKSYGKNKLDGRIFMIRHTTKEVVLLQDSLAFPNGIGFSPIDKKLYVCESAKNRILRFTLSDNYKLSDKEIFIELPGGDPDGFNFDEKGNMYVAHFGSGSLFIISPTREILQTIKTPGSKPTNVEFGGNKNKTLYLTETETNSLYSLKSNISGE